MPTNYIPNGYQDLNAVIWGNDQSRITSYLEDGRVVWVAKALTAPVESIIWNTDGTIQLPGIVANTVRESFTATAGQTIFNLSNTYLTGTNSIEVYVNGIRKLIGVSFNETSSTVVTFLSGLTNGDKVDFYTRLFNQSPFIFSTGSTYLIPAGGNLGIGTTTPSSKLDVIGSVEVDSRGAGQQDYLLMGAWDTILHKLYRPAATNTLQLDAYGNIVLNGGVSESGMILLETAGAERMRIGDFGASLQKNLSVYPTDTLGGLTISGTSHPTITLIENSLTRMYLGTASTTDAFFTGIVRGDVCLRAETGKIHLGKYGLSSPSITIDGLNIGIGTSVPTRLLDVSHPTSLACIRINSLTAQQCALEFSKNGVSKWINYIDGGEEDLRWYNNTTRMLLTADGSIHLPQSGAMIHLQGTSGGLKFSGGAEWVWRNADGSLDLWTGSTCRVKVTAAGGVVCGASGGLLSPGAGDLAVNRLDNTGAIYFGLQTGGEVYLYYDGSKYIFSGGGLTIPGVSYIRKDQNDMTFLHISNLGTGTMAQAGIRFSDDLSNDMSIGVTCSNNTNFGAGLDHSPYFYATQAKPWLWWLNGAERLRLTEAGVLALGTTVVTSANSGELVLGNNKALRAVNVAGNNTREMIKYDTYEVIQLAPGYTGVAVPHITSASLLAGQAALSGYLVVDITNNRLCYYSNGNRYYLTGTSF